MILADILYGVDKKSRRAGGMVLIHATSIVKNPLRNLNHEINNNFKLTSTF